MSFLEKRSREMLDIASVKYPRTNREAESSAATYVTPIDIPC